MADEDTDRQLAELRQLLRQLRDEFSRDMHDIDTRIVRIVNRLNEIDAQLRRRK